MPTSAATTINSVLSRQRDANALLMATAQPPTTASGRAFVLTLVNHAQLFINLAERLLVKSGDLYLSNNQTVYDLTQVIGSDYCGKVVGCNVAGVGEVDGPVDYKALGRANRQWLVATDANITTAPIAWAPIGTTLLVLIPAFASGLIDVTIRYMQVPTVITNESTTLDVPDLAAEHVARLASMIASIKSRQLTDFDNRLKQLAKDIQAMDALQTTGGKAS